MSEGKIIFNDRAKQLEAGIIDTLKQILDPDIGIDIVNLGLIYEINLDEAKHLTITMTFTSVGCTCVVTVPIEMKARLTELEGIDSVTIETVWKPPWTPMRITRFGRISLGIRV